MLRIREEQFAALGKLAYERFVGDALAYVGALELLPLRVPDELEAWVRAGIERALALGLLEELVVLRFLETVARFGDRFAERADVLAVLANLERATEWDDTMRLLRALDASEPARGATRDDRGATTP